MTLFLLVSIVHVIFFLLLGLKWSSIAVRESGDGARVPVTILIPVRNEAAVIKRLIDSIDRQDYDKKFVEVLVIDDHSDDGTPEQIELLASRSKLMLKMLHLSADKAGKKAASSLGVATASHDLILCTDADCQLPANWISSHVNALKDNMMVTGPVRIGATTFFEQLQSLEFSALIAYGGVTLAAGYPGMCNGANMSYRKVAFNEVGGYEGNDHIPTGDDEFLLQKISRKYPGQVAFLKSQDALVTTEPKETPDELWIQRIRWTSKWRFHKSRFIHLSAILVFLDFIVGAALLPVAVATVSPWVYLMVASRWGSEWYFLTKAARFFQVKTSIWLLAALSSIYPYYVLFLGFASIFGKYSWKGRRY